MPRAGRCDCVWRGSRSHPQACRGAGPWPGCVRQLPRGCGGRKPSEQAPAWEPRGGRTVMAWPTLHQAARPAHPSVRLPSVLAGAGRSLGSPLRGETEAERGDWAAPVPRGSREGVMVISEAGTTCLETGPDAASAGAALGHGGPRNSHGGVERGPCHLAALSLCPGPHPGGSGLPPGSLSLSARPAVRNPPQCRGDPAAPASLLDGKGRSPCPSPCAPPGPRLSRCSPVLVAVPGSELP